MSSILGILLQRYPLLPLIMMIMAVIYPRPPPIFVRFVTPLSAICSAPEGRCSRLSIEAPVVLRRGALEFSSLLAIGAIAAVSLAHCVLY